MGPALDRRGGPTRDRAARLPDRHARRRPREARAGAHGQVLRGWTRSSREQGPLDGVLFTTIQELATRLSHRNTGAITEDETAEKVCARVATDENLHYVFYRDIAMHAIAVDPHAMLGDQAAGRRVRDARRRHAGVPREGQGDGARRHLQRPHPSGAGAAAGARDALEDRGAHGLSDEAKRRARTSTRTSRGSNGSHRSSASRSARCGRPLERPRRPGLTETPSRFRSCSRSA